MTRALLLMVSALAAVGCGETPDTTTSPSTPETATLTGEVFTGTLDVGGLRFYSFSVPENSGFSVLLGSLSTARSPALPDLAVGLGVGTPAGTSCAVRESVVTSPALTTQFRSWAAEGIHCVAIYDIGNLREPVAFVVRLTHY